MNKLSFEEISPRVEQAVRREIDAGYFPGAVIMAGRPREFQFHEAFGAARVQPHNVPMRRDAVFDIASVTKVVATATAVGICVDRGLIDLDAPACRYLPRLAAAKPQPPTVRQLGTHISGFNNSKFDHLEGDAMIEAMLAAPVQWEPGTHYEYSCLNFILLGLIVEEVSRQPFDLFCEEHIFRPLGMSDTHFGPLEDSPRIVGTEQPIAGEISDGQARAARRPVGNAGLFSTATDLARFCEMMLGRGSLGQIKVLSKTVHEELTRPSTPRGLPLRGIGWDCQPADDVSHRPRLLSEAAYGHGGWTGQSLWIDTERDLYIIILTNRTHPTIFQEQMDTETRRARARIADTIIG
ncbi:MAG: beta-lactamase family protein [Phycisphaerae bacterium]|nr:beta-lactamase family protein [Phycisphaerae bacterium]